MPPNTVYVGRPTVWGNPFTFTTEREEALEKYRDWLEGELLVRPRLLEPLKGKNLACWCPLNLPCHADILIAKLNREQEK